MGWFWNDPSSKAKPATDPFHRLDPEVRDFLLRESPLKPPPSPTTSPTSTPQSSPNPQTAAATTPSKYGDRYADIWEQHAATSTVAQDASKSSQEQLSDIIQAYKWRKGAIGRAALENCANEQYALYDCYKSGSLKERMMACSAYSHRLQECYVSQAKFLRALGYMSDFSRDPQVDEKIQMHADKLYIEQKRQDEEAAGKSSEGTLSDPPTTG